MMSETEFSVRVFSHDFKVIVGSPGGWSETSMGNSSVLEQKIQLNAAMPHDVRCSTLLHELVHAISDLMSAGLSEAQVDAVAVGMFTIIKDNPELIAELAGVSIQTEESCL